MSRGGDTDARLQAAARLLHLQDRACTPLAIHPCWYAASRACWCCAPSHSAWRHAFARVCTASLIVDLPMARLCNPARLLQSVLHSVTCIPPTPLHQPLPARRTKPVLCCERSGTRRVHFLLRLPHPTCTCTCPHSYASTSTRNGHLGAPRSSSSCCAHIHPTCIVHPAPAGGHIRTAPRPPTSPPACSAPAPAHLPSLHCSAPPMPSPRPPRAPRLRVRWPPHLTATPFHPFSYAPSTPLHPACTCSSTPLHPRPALPGNFRHAPHD
jgi:hypothetical protein